jgi:SlyX protein
MSETTLETRLEDLEVRFAFQDENIHQLDSVIQSQALEIERLRNEVAAVREQLKETLGPEAPPEEQVPPHY